MADPLVIYDRAPLANPSWDDGATGTSAPGWTFNAGDGDLWVQDNVNNLIAGSNHGVQHLRLQDFGATDPEAISDAVPAGPLDAGTWWYPPAGTWCALAGGLDSDDPDTPTFTIQVRELSSGDVPQTTHELVRSKGTSQAWPGFSLVFQLVGNGVKLDVRIGFSGFNLAGRMDQLHLGRAVDFTRQFQSVQARERARRHTRIHAGDAHETYKLADPLAEVRATYGPIYDGTVLDDQVRAFNRLASSWRAFGFWLDRDEPRNRQLHFATCIRSPATVQERLRGVGARRNYELEFSTPQEWILQAAGGR